MYMKGFAGLVSLVLGVAALAVSCSKDKVKGTLEFEVPAVFMQAGDEAVVRFSSSRIESFTVTQKPTGWNDPVVDIAARTVTIVSPVTFGEDIEGDDGETTTVETSGTVVLTGYSSDGVAASASLFVSVTSTVDLEGPANSYLVNKPAVNYRFDVRHTGNGGSTIEPASLAVVWQSKSGLIEYLRLTDDGKASFYIDADEDDDTRIAQGNALIGAYDASDNLLWSWHVWAADYDPEAADGTVVFNGQEMMTRNLGALDNDNSTTDRILASYGTYYQWGRKEPFIGPNTYSAGSGSSATMYNGSGGRVTLETVAASAETGTAAYALQHPLTYITGVTDSSNDWCWAHDSSLWSAAEKTENDPCPAGWRVAPASAYAGLAISGTPGASDFDKYGWTFTREGASSFFLGAGRRLYTNGKIQNLYVVVPASSSLSTRNLPRMPSRGRVSTGRPTPLRRVRMRRPSTSGSRRRVRREVSRIASPTHGPTACRCVVCARNKRGSYRVAAGPSFGAVPFRLVRLLRSETEKLIRSCVFKRVKAPSRPVFFWPSGPCRPSRRFPAWPYPPFWVI